MMKIKGKTLIISARGPETFSTVSMRSGKRTIVNKNSRTATNIFSKVLIYPHNHANTKQIPIKVMRKPFIAPS